MSIYDEEIKTLTKDFESGEFYAFVNAWSRCTPLFSFCTKSRKYQYIPEKGIEGGCLTMIRSGLAEGVINPDGSVNEKLTEEIKKDKRIPKDPYLITPKDLPVFKEWQERLDVELKRTV